MPRQISGLHTTGVRTNGAAPDAYDYGGASTSGASAWDQVARNAQRAFGSKNTAQPALAALPPKSLPKSVEEDLKFGPFAIDVDRHPELAEEKSQYVAKLRESKAGREELKRVTEFKRIALNGELSAKALQQGYDDEKPEAQGVAYEHAIKGAIQPLQDALKRGGMGRETIRRHTRLIQEKADDLALGSGNMSSGVYKETMDALKPIHEEADFSAYWGRQNRRTE